MKYLLFAPLFVMLVVLSLGTTRVAGNKHHYSPKPSIESPVPSEAPQPGCCSPTSGESFTNDGKPTYDPNRSDRGGKDPVIPSAAPATGFGEGR